MVWIAPDWSNNPDLDEIRNLLRTAEPLPQEMRNWLADILDPKAKSKWRAELKHRNEKGGRPSNFLLTCEIVNFVDEGGYEQEFDIAEGEKVKIDAKIQAAVSKFSLTREAIKKHRTAYKQAMEAEHDQKAHDIEQIVDV
jgi:hypothetical protein